MKPTASPTTPCSRIKPIKPFICCINNQIK
jgi:hypothetical protein